MKKRDQLQSENRNETTLGSLQNNLYNILNEKFSLADLRLLVFKLRGFDQKIDFDNLSGSTKEEKIQELILYMERRENLLLLERVVKSELTVPRRISRWLQNGQKIVIVSIVGIISVAIVAIAIVGGDILKGNPDDWLPPLDSPLPSPKILLDDFADCNNEILENFIEQLEIIPDLIINDSDLVADIEIKGQCQNDQITMNFSALKQNPAFYQMSSPKFIIVTFPQQTDVKTIGRISRALIYYHNNSFEEALEIFNEVGDENFVNFELKLLKANSFLLNTKYDQAIEKYTSLEAELNHFQYEQIAIVNNNLAVTYLNRGVQASLEENIDLFEQDNDRALLELEDGLKHEQNLSDEIIQMLYINITQVHLSILDMNMLDEVCEILLQNRSNNPIIELNCLVEPLRFEMYEPANQCKRDRFWELDKELEILGNQYNQLADINFLRASLANDFLVNRCELDSGEVDRLTKLCQTQFLEFRLKFHNKLAPLQTHYYMSQLEAPHPCMVVS